MYEDVLDVLTEEIPTQVVTDLMYEVLDLVKKYQSLDYSDLKTAIIRLDYTIREDAPELLN